jgi:hypothetical protein
MFVDAGKISTEISVPLSLPDQRKWRKKVLAKSQRSAHRKLTCVKDDFIGVMVSIAKEFVDG